jgi:N-acetylmuramoyl-L-alanine amidase
MKRIIILLAALGAAVFVLGTRIRAADESFPIYFENSKLVVKAETFNSTTYVPLVQIVQTLGLPYTDSTGLETITIRSGSSRLVLTKNSALISIDGQVVLLANAIRHEGGRWLVPIDFLTRGLAKLSGTTFRYRPGTSRLFVGDVAAPELVMNAQVLGSITRLTIRVATPIDMQVRRENPQRAVLTINQSPVDPLREQLSQRDRLVRSIAFDDSDGVSKILVETTDEVKDIKLTASDGNRLYFVDFLRSAETTATPITTGIPAKPDALPPSQGSVRVVVIDPGHGGEDTGARGETIVEKDLTLALARRLRTALQGRLGATVLLTRDSDIEMTNEARSAVANNNQANLFVSLHIGYSANTGDTGSSIFVMKEDFGGTSGTAGFSRDRMFLPWYLGYRTRRDSSVRAANLLRDELGKVVTDWKFPVRTAILGVLTSATMPSVLLEVGNVNNPATSATLTDTGFQTRLVASVVNAIEHFSQVEPRGSN